MKDNTMYGGLNECIECEPGYYSDGSMDRCAPCTAGFICFGGTNKAEPDSFSQNKGVICPPGHYCKEGSSFAVPVPPRTYSFAWGVRSIEQARLCPKGTYNALEG